ncbi:MAG: lipid-A-disaccharide synthase [Gammaproteobacteria bacterium]
MAFRVGLIAGEASGDLLGAGLVREIRRYYPETLFEGVAGPAMLEAGVRGWLPLERLSVMGLTEVVRHLPDLLAVRGEVVTRLLAARPDVVVGVDSPDFNLGVEARVRAAGIPTVQYVSPSVWAWRPGRIRQIARAADRVLCLLPFETAIYEQHGLDAVFVGHPMADAIPMEPDPAAAREALGLGADDTVVALLPGSRLGEVQRLGSPFAEAAAWMAGRRSGLKFMAPMASAAVRRLFEAQVAKAAPGVGIRLVDGRARQVLEAADVVLVASGTATLEAALLKRPMVVSYKVSETTRRLVETLRLMKIRHFALPNLLAGEELVPELIQDAATPEALGSALLELLDDPDRRARLAEHFGRIHRTLRRNADRRAAEAVLELVGRLPGGPS